MDRAADQGCRGKQAGAGRHRNVAGNRSDRAWTAWAAGSRSGNRPNTVGPLPVMEAAMAPIFSRAALISKT